MGREIRRVPPNWEHPKDEFGHDRQMFDQTFEQAATEWKKGLLDWESGIRLDWCDKESSKLEYWEWNDGPPDREMYRPWKDEEATWFQVWQTVGEGSPVTPPFATLQELADYLAEYGDTWDQKRGDRPWGRKAADAFCKSGYAPSAMNLNGRLVESKNMALELEKDKQHDGR